MPKKLDVDSETERVPWSHQNPGFVELMNGDELKTRYRAGRTQSANLWTPD
jgi:hypothetical protein